MNGKFKTGIFFSTVIALVFLSACNGETNDDGVSDNGTDTEDSDSTEVGTEAGEENDTDGTDSQSDSDEFKFRPLQFAPSTITAEVPVISAYEMGTNGFVTIRNRHIRNDYEDTIADAQFYNVLSRQEEFINKKYIIRGDGLDECSLGVWMEEGSGSSETSIDWLNAGDVSLRVGEDIFDMDWDYINRESQSVRYYVSEFSESVSGHLSGEIDVLATGNETPEMTQGMIRATMPDNIELIFPQNDYEIIHYGPLNVEWSAGDPSNTVEINMQVYEKFNESEAGFELRDIHEVKCTVSDDGRFDIPGAIMNQLPVNYSADLEITRRNVEYHDVQDTFVVQTITSQSVRIDLTIPNVAVDIDGTL
jgi:hypothetical protein